MSDRELLELAAKAAGIEGRWERDHNFKQERWYFNVPYDNHNMLTGFEWNPLTDDGEALRLAVKLGIHITNSLSEAWASTEKVTAIQIFDQDTDPYASTRRAIVRAAAEIGKVMK